MKAYKITLQLFERDENSDDVEDHGDKVQIITVANSIAIASDYAKAAYEKSDATVDGFYWEVICAEKIEGLVALPAMKCVAPKTS